MHLCSEQGPEWDARDTRRLGRMGVGRASPRGQSPALRLGDLGGLSVPVGPLDLPMGVAAPDRGQVRNHLPCCFYVYSLLLQPPALELYVSSFHFLWAHGGNSVEACEGRRNKMVFNTLESTYFGNTHKHMPVTQREGHMQNWFL